MTHNEVARQNFKRVFIKSFTKGLGEKGRQARKWRITKDFNRGNCP
jgi:hypothetical protein